MRDIVLLVDDQAYVFSSLADRLAAENLLLERASDATAGLYAAIRLEKRLTIILIDIIMKPGRRVMDPTGGRQSGVCLAEMIRSYGINIPIIFYTVVTDEDIRKRASKVASSCYISRISPKQLISVIDRERLR